MKNYVKILSLFLAAIISCKNDNEKNSINEKVKVLRTSDSTSEKTKKVGESIQKYEYVYQAFDGTKANITFTKGTKDGNFILIERNKLKIELPQKEAWENGAIYEKDGIKAETNGNKLTITQNGNVFELERKK